MRPATLPAALAALMLAASSAAQEAGAPAATTADPAQDAQVAPATEGSGAAGEAREAVAPPPPEGPDDAAEGVERSAILPSADDHEASRAPSMAIDCGDGDADCLGEPLDGPSVGPALSEPGPAQGPERVVAEP